MAEETRKNAVWTFNNNTNIVRVTFPDDRTQTFDLTFLVAEVSEMQKLMLMYGFKQFVASNAAAEKTSADKIASFDVDYEDLVNGHLVMFGEGKLGFSNRTRANAAPRTADKAVESKFTSMTLDECNSLLTMQKLGVVKLSDEMTKKVLARIEELENV